MSFCLEPPEPAGTSCKQRLIRLMFSPLKPNAIQPFAYAACLCVKGRNGARTHGSTVARWHTPGPQHFPLFSPALGDRSDKADDNVDAEHTLCATYNVLH